jgi:hypothetical protein
MSAPRTGSAANPYMRLPQEEPRQNEPPAWLSGKVTNLFWFGMAAMSVVKSNWYFRNGEHAQAAACGVIALGCIFFASASTYPRCPRDRIDRIMNATRGRPNSTETV